MKVNLKSLVIGRVICEIIFNIMNIVSIGISDNGNINTSTCLGKELDPSHLQKLVSFVVHRAEVNGCKGKSFLK